MSFNSKYTGAQVEAWLDNIKNYSANDILEKLKTVDGSNSGLDADLLDGVQESDFCRHFDGVHIESHRSIGYGYTAQGWILNGPALSIGHSEGTYLMQLQAPADYTALHFRNRMNGVWGYWKEIAFTDSNVASATKLQTARTIWGQSFDGTGNVSGDFTIPSGYGYKFSCNNVQIPANGDRITFNSLTGTYTKGILAMNTGNTYIQAPLSSDSSSGAQTPILIGWTNGVYVIYIDPSGNVGIGTTNPSYKLDVSGDIHASGSVIQNSDINLKNISKDILISLNDIAEAPLFEFTYKNDENKRIHVGTSAQYWVEKNNWFCKKQDNGYYDMEIQNLALASAISIAKEFKKYKEETESTINNMKKEIEELKQIILYMNK